MNRVSWLSVSLDFASCLSLGKFDEMRIVEFVSFKLSRCRISKFGDLELVKISRLQNFKFDGTWILELQGCVRLSNGNCDEKKAILVRANDRRTYFAEGGNIGLTEDPQTL